MLFALALIPPIVLLVIIYFSDRKEKEPFGLLAILFVMGIVSVLPIMIVELLETVVVGLIFPYESEITAVITAFLIAGLVEESFKFLFLWLFTWKNKNFDYIFDAIVYSVFVSLGFAALENVLYVFQNGFATGILRMFTSIPGHAIFAVVMGVFYGKAKYSAVKGDKKGAARNMVLSIVAPILVHGLYDALLMIGEATYYDAVQVICIILWIGVVIAMYVVGIILVVRTSKKDFCIAVLDDNTQVIYRPTLVGSWTCGCGRTNTGNFCPSCGHQRPMIQKWFCTQCGTESHWNFCGNCGAPKPVLQREPVAVPTTGMENTIL